MLNSHNPLGFISNACILSSPQLPPLILTPELGLAHPPLLQAPAPAAASALQIDLHVLLPGICTRGDGLCVCDCATACFSSPFNLQTAQLPAKEGEARLIGGAE
jgi:hypothetical protein